MSKSIYKYTILLDGNDNAIEPPAGAIPLYVQMQASFLQVWLEVEAAAPNERRVFRVFGTGHRIPYEYKYIGSCMDGAFVWHLYELDLTVKPI